MLSISPEELEMGTIYEGTPCIIQDHAFTSFSADLDCAIDFTNNESEIKVILTIMGKKGDNVLYTGGTDSEIIFPRNYPFVTTGYKLDEWQECRVIFISLDKYKRGLI